MSRIQSARDRARAEVQAEILATARQHLAEHGPVGLSLRAVARDLELVPSAVYRYFDNRDALLTAMIVAAYDALGSAAEAALAAAPRTSPRRRWVEVALAIRRWALDHPHEYGLLYGTPVPGYAAPDDTVGPGTRVSLALVQVVADAVDDGLVDTPPGGEPSGPISGELDRLAAQIGLEIPPPTVFRLLLAWTQLFGLLSFELFSQTRGVVTDHERFFTEAAEAMATGIGLAEPSTGS